MESEFTQGASRGSVHPTVVARASSVLLVSAYHFGSLLESSNSGLTASEPQGAPNS